MPTIDLGAALGSVGLKANGADDCTAVLRDCIKQASRSKLASTVTIPEAVGGVGRGPIPGVRLTEPISLPARVSLEGLSTSGGSVLVVDHDDVGIHVSAFGNTIERLQLKAADMRIPHAAIEIFASDAAGVQGSYFTARDIQINSGPWTLGILVDGTRKVNNPIGVRALHFENVRTFDTIEASLYAKNTVSMTLSGWRAHRGRGVKSDIIIDGAWTVLGTNLATNGDLIVRNTKTGAFGSVVANRVRRWAKGNTRVAWGAISAGEVVMK